MKGIRINTLKEPDLSDVRLQDLLKGEFEILPLRTLDNFLLASAKFQIPDYKTEDSWRHRVFDNLYYYQTNYFLTGIFIFIYFLFMYNTKLLYGAMLTYNLIRLFPWLRNKRSFNIQDLITVGISIVLLSYFEFSIYYAVSSLMLFWTSISTIIFVTFVHASLRSRNLCNNLVNFLDQKDKRTPMTVLIYTSISYLMNNVVLPSLKKLPRRRRRFYD